MIVTIAAFAQNDKEPNENVRQHKNQIFHYSRCFTPKIEVCNEFTGPIFVTDHQGNTAICVDVKAACVEPFAHCLSDLADLAYKLRLSMKHAC